MPLTQYPKIDLLIEELLSFLKESLGNQLKGLYLFGSLVGGDFDPHSSDIDLLAITSSGITEQELARLKALHGTFMRAHPEWADRIEVAYVGTQGMKNFKTTTNQIARISPGEPLHFRDMDIQWLMDWYMVQDQGLTIFGPPSSTFIPHITQAEFITSLKHSIIEWPARANEAKRKGYQSYIILSLCRSLYVFKFGDQISKFKAAEWAEHEYPEWAQLISQATHWHGSSDNSDSPATQADTIKFVAFALKQAHRQP